MNKRCKVNYALLDTKFVSVEAISLLKSMLEKNPEKRLSASDCLDHDFFNTVPDEINLKYVV